jgi:hypothetical protein
MRFDRRISLPGFTGPKLNIMTRTYHELQELNPDCGRSTGVDSLTSIRHTLRALASESGPRDALDKVRLLRPLVTKARDILRKRFESGDSPEANLRHRARFADSVVIGLLHIASISKGIRDGSMVAPLAAIAVGLWTKRTHLQLRTRPALSYPRKQFILRRKCRPGDPRVHWRCSC